MSELVLFYWNNKRLKVLTIFPFLFLHFTQARQSKCPKSLPMPFLVNFPPGLPCLNSSCTGFSKQIRPSNKYHNWALSHAAFKRFYPKCKAWFVKSRTISAQSWAESLMSPCDTEMQTNGHTGSDHQDRPAQVLATTVASTSCYRGRLNKSCETSYEITRHRGDVLLFPFRSWKLVQVFISGGRLFLPKALPCCISAVTILHALLRPHRVLFFQSS